MNAMHFRQAVLTVNGNTHQLTPERSNSFDEIHVDFQNQPERGGSRYSVFLHPKQDVTIQRLEIQFDVQLPPDARFFANGFQSWSESRLMRLDEGIPRLRFFAKKYMGLYGDEHIPGIPHGRGYLHSWTYTYFTAHGARSAVHGQDVVNEQRTTTNEQRIVFLGSLNESTGFTLFLYDQPNGILTVRKDMDGLQLSHSFPALDFWMGEGTEQEMFEHWFALLETPQPAALPAIGWTSWYHHFTNISEDILLQNLNSFATFYHSERSEESEEGIMQGIHNQMLRSARHDKQAAFFQIDDGWQTAVGDWLSVKPTFPHGMGFLAEKIRANGLSPGLWLAPFVAAKDSDLAKKHPDWLLKGKNGCPLKVGWNPMWGGWYHALDFYNNEVRNHLGGIFHVVLDKWSFELVKLDFLFAVCLAPPPGKTRGQVMHEAMEFLRKLVEPKKILGCGVPLGSAFGLADYCRVGGDIHLSWEYRLLRFLRFRERVSTMASLRSTLGRWQLNGRAFHNDPDVFILRNENQKLTPAQQQTVLTINALLGNLLFTSDDVGKYSPEQMAELEAALELRGSRVKRVFEIEKDVYRIDFENNAASYSAFCNLTGAAKSLSAGLPAMTAIEMRAYENIILKTAP